MYEKATREANYSIKIPFITIPCENRIKQRTQIIIITNNANIYNNINNNDDVRKRIENVAKLLKGSSTARKKFLPLNWLSFCWKFVFRFLCIFFFFLAHWCARLIYYSARQQKNVFFLIIVQLICTMATESVFIA